MGPADQARQPAKALFSPQSPIDQVANGAALSGLHAAMVLDSEPRNLVMLMSHFALKQ